MAGNFNIEFNVRTEAGKGGENIKKRSLEIIILKLN
jgi:hypothetical protein